MVLDQNLTSRSGRFQYRGTLPVLTRRVNRVLYLALIIRRLISSEENAGGGKITLCVIQLHSESKGANSPRR
jgi:hypothetical protein